MKSCLAVLDGSLTQVAPATDLGESMPATVTLEQVTTHFTKNLLAQNASEKRSDMKGLGLVQVQIQANQCLFVPATDQTTLVQLDRIDSMDQVESVFQWRNGKSQCLRLQE